MTSYLTTILALQLDQLGRPHFLAKHPNAWLVWEPGAWKPPARATLVASTSMNPTTTGDALAMALKPKGADAALTVGREPGCDLQINDGTLSGHHLSLVPADGAWAVRDAGSKNGTTLNGLKLASGQLVRLDDGARLQCGQVQLTFHSADGMLTRLGRVLQGKHKAP